MKIQLLGNNSSTAHFQTIFPNHTFVVANVENIDIDAALTIDLDHDFVNRIDIYESMEGVVLCNSVNVLLEAHLKNNSSNVFGFNGLSGLISSNALEVCIPNGQDAAQLDKALEDAQFNHLVVDSRVGLVTPRIILMIINEAFFTVQEGTANKSDIDMAMKLGTAYPRGPFEWSEMIGLPQIVDCLDAIYHDTQDERYKICPLLKKEALQ